MDITCLSDCHGHYPSLPGGDLLILAGDYTARDRVSEWAAFFSWLKKQKYTKKILIGGNHDNFLFTGLPNTQREADSLAEVRALLSEEELEGIDDFEYLCDSGTEIEYQVMGGTDTLSCMGIVITETNKLKVWGSPWTKTFPGMNPHCMAFTCETEEELAEKWALIPADIDILITHSPPHGVLDGVPNYSMEKAEHVGSTSLHKELNRIRPQWHIFGHVHEGYGQYTDYFEVFCGEKQIRYINASHVNERYKPVNAPMRIEL